jgi:hypothetical protein
LVPDEHGDNVITLLFKQGQTSGAEENLVKQIKNLLGTS